MFFHPIDGSGSLTISWSSGPKGDAVEVKKGAGVGLFSEKGDPLCVIFDEVQSDNDHQILEFKSYCIEINIKDSRVIQQVTHKETQRKITPRMRKRHSKRKQTI